MRLRLDYSVRYLQLDESLIIPLNYYADNNLLYEGNQFISNLIIPKDKKDKLLNVFKSYLIPNQEI